jgi:hypothetical protein
VRGAVGVVSVGWAAGLVLVLLLPLACTSPFSADLDPRPLDPVERGEYDGPPPEVTGAREMSADDVERLARVFYTRIINRRFNSIATFHDPALRELFSAPEAFADYFAALADALTVAHFEALRPTAAKLEKIDVLEPDAVLVTIRFRGQNSLPLRWWSVELARTDRWERSEGRWWIIPGKL